MTEEKSQRPLIEVEYDPTQPSGLDRFKEQLRKYQEELERQKKEQEKKDEANISDR